LKFESVRFAEQGTDRITSSLQGNQHQIITVVKSGYEKAFSNTRQRTKSKKHKSQEKRKEEVDTSSV
jgi:hypothetical protein